MLVRWHIFQSQGLKTEAQLFQSEAGTNDKVILFCPGFPGVGATLFEQRHAAALVEEGYDVVVLKHKGIRLDTPSAPLMINNAARLMTGRRKGETHIGDGPATIEEWLREPGPACVELSERYAALYVIGNSFGALSALWSLTTEIITPGRLRSVLLLAGAQGTTGKTSNIMRIWRPEFIAAPRITGKVSLNDPVEIAATMKKVYQELPARVVVRLPESVDLTFLAVAKDEILAVQDTKAFQKAIGGRGRIVVDETGQAWPEYGLLAHDTPDYKTEDLLALLRGQDD